jgi:hypothetical protein
MINFRRKLRKNLSNYSLQELNSSLSPAKPGDGQQAESLQGKAFELTAMVAKRGWHVNCRESNLRRESPGLAEALILSP